MKSFVSTSTPSARPRSALLTLALLAASTLAAPASRASESVVGRSETQASGESSERPARRMAIFGGFGYGYSAMTGSELSRPNGSEMEASLLVSGYWDRWVIDVGGGWSRTRVQGALPDSTDMRYTVETPFAELSPRYRLTERFQLGPVLDLKFGSNLSFGSDATPADRKNALPLAGLKAVYELPVKAADLRLLAKPMADVSLPGRSLLLFVAGIEIGLSSPRTMASSSAPVIEAPVVAAAPARAQQAAVAVEIPGKSVHFKTGSAELDAPSRAFLVSLGKSIASSESAWKELEITGHADERGNEDANRALSEARALSVRTALVEGGVTASRLHHSGKGSSEPVDKSSEPTAWRKNRRVELVFTGVSDPAALRIGKND